METNLEDSGGADILNSPKTETKNGSIATNANQEVYQAAIEKLHFNTKNLRSSAVVGFDAALTAIVDEFVAEVKRTQVRRSADATVPGYEHQSSRFMNASSESNTLPEKEFLVRRSVLTEMLELTHIKTIYNVFVAVLLVLFINTAVQDLLETGSLLLHLELVTWSFDQLHTVMAIWVLMFGGTVLLLYPGFQHWANKRYFQEDKRLWDMSWLSLYLVYAGLMVYFPARQVVVCEFPPACSMIVLCEQVRLIMKVHAFIRTTVPAILEYEPLRDNISSSEDLDYDDGPCPDFQKFLYFLFAPTLIYRDSYPRTTRVRWSYVVSNFFQMIACVFYVHYVFVRFMVPVFKDYGKEPIKINHVVQSIFASMLPGTLVLLIGFFAVLHSWLNAFAEMLQFGDRMFYKDWWNSTSYSKYYRTWNVVVHDWLYFYVYKDCYQLTNSMRYRRHISRFMVIAMSAIVHEYIVTFTLGFFYPILFVLFGMIGVLFLFLPDNRYPNVWNVYLWVTLFIGNGLLLSLYSMEWYARVNCAPLSDSFWGQLVPRTWTCD